MRGHPESSVPALCAARTLGTCLTPLGLMIPHLRRGQAVSMADQSLIGHNQSLFTEGDSW